MTQAFQDTKQALVEATLFAHPRHNALISLTTDASNLAVGAVLQQSMDGTSVPLAFFSQKLRPLELKYSTFDRELLALYLSIHHFRYFLEGRQFTIFTDHKPLTHCMSKVSDPWSNCQQRQLSYISKFTTDIQHVKGDNNTVADALSRATVSDVSLGINFQEMAKDQQDAKVQAYRVLPSSLQVKDILSGLMELPYSVISPRDIPGQLYQPIGDVRCSTCFIVCLTTLFVRHES